jgi:hypothetical protein
MRAWWPWRKSKQLLSLFDPPFGYYPDALFVGFTNQGEELHPKNAPGPFYVVNTECITCGAPHVAAPDLMAWELDSQGGELHCYFKKQPETLDEVDRAIRAIDTSCCGALVYAGSDADIIKKLRKAGCKHAIVRRE